MTLTQRDERLRDFIAVVSNETGRLYLTGEEVRWLMRTNRRHAMKWGDLDIRRYPGKWRVAVEGQIRAGGDPAEEAFWAKARLGYEERGGGYR